MIPIPTTFENTYQPKTAPLGKLMYLPYAFDKNVVRSCLPELKLFGSREVGMETRQLPGFGRQVAYKSTSSKLHHPRPPRPTFGVNPNCSVFSETDCTNGGPAAERNTAIPIPSAVRQANACTVSRSPHHSAWHIPGQQSYMTYLCPYLGDFEALRNPGR